MQYSRRQGGVSKYSMRNIKNRRNETRKERKKRRKKEGTPACLRRDSFTAGLVEVFYGDMHSISRRGRGI